MRLRLFILLLVSLFFFQSPAEAYDTSLGSAITIVNPIRGNGLGHAGHDLVASIKAQWEVTQELGVPATWLMQYGALESTGITDFATQSMQGHEFGLLFEIDRNFAEKSGVQFRGQGEWYFSDGLFLNSYDQAERKKLIDAAFRKFKEVFGYYPTTVGAWWIGADSLTYMQETYGITAAMRAADQFNLDLYSIWGTPWNIPYVSSREHQGIPGASFDESTKVVNIQWAIREPLNGYADATYSLQDYSLKGYSTDYIDYLFSIYLNKPLGNIVIGVENGGMRDVFESYYTTWVKKAKEAQASGLADIELVSDFAKRYLDQKKTIAGSRYALSQGYQTLDQSFWYVSENYRVTIHKTGNTVRVVDLRNYAEKVEEDFYVMPNSQARLWMTTPFIIDSMRSPGQELILANTEEPLSVREDDDQVQLYIGSQPIALFASIGPTFYPTNENEVAYAFEEKTRDVPLLYVLFAVAGVYFCIVLLHTRRVSSTLAHFCLLLIPLLLASQFLVSNSTFLFDKKEMLWVYSIFSLRGISIVSSVYIIKLLPFFILFLLHYVYLKKPGRSTQGIVFWIYFCYMVIQYLHVPYFPLDKTTYTGVFIVFCTLVTMLIMTSIFMYAKLRTKNVRIVIILAPFFILFVLLGTVVFSRSKYALTTYEIQALEVLRNQMKDVLYIEQVDYSILPIYKAVKPLLYNNLLVSQILTGVTWQKMLRPENDMLTISDYNEKLIVIPRYFNADISEHEVELLELREIFDNAQIAIYEKPVL